MAITQPLSESVNGQPIDIVAGATPGDLLHIGTLGKIDMVRLVVNNVTAAPLVLILEWGTLVATQNLEISVAADTMVELPEIPFTGGAAVSPQEIRGFCATPNGIKVLGEVRQL